MIGKWRQLLSRFSLPEHLQLIVKRAEAKIQFYFCLLVTIAGALVALRGFLDLIDTPSNQLQEDKLVALYRLVIGIFAIAFGGRFSYLVFRHNRPYLESKLFDIDIDDYSIDDDTSTIHIGTGNYNRNVSGNHNKFIAGDNIQGDYITVQGDFININSDLSEVADQLLEIVTRLKDEGHSKEEAEWLVTRDLVNQAKNNSTVKIKLRRWGQSTGSTTNRSSLSEVAKAVVQATTEPFLSVESIPAFYADPDTEFYDLDPIEAADFQELEDLLKAERWREADEITASIILTPLIDDCYEMEYLINQKIQEYIKRFPGGDLRLINNLWVKYSKGRFGFSIQQSIWAEVKDFKLFGNRVEWCEHDKWIYCSDISYSLKAPPGHLPMRVMVNNLPLSSTCKEAEALFKTFVSRQYKNY
jgi:hypothetical protein